MTMQCKSCQYYEPFSSPDGQARSEGVCRRYPPKVMLKQQHAETFWPTVSEKDYCGEYRHDINETHPL